jgi:ATP-dependent exoDNAse (exonuclease V) beta subunit
MRLDPTAVGILYGMTRNAWAEVEQWFPEPRECERYFESTFGDLLLTGHLDVLAFAEDDTEARICDYKTGWLDADCEDQQRGYGWLVC